MASSGQRYAVGIGTGAAAGAATGSVLGPWGALVGGAIGGVGGAISAAMGNSEEAKQRALMEEQERRKKKAFLLQLLRNHVAESGVPTESLDAQLGLRDLDYENLQNDRAFTAAHRIGPQAFVPLAQAGTQAAGNIYNSFQTPKVEASQLQPLQLQQPGLLQEPNYEYSLDPKRYSVLREPDNYSLDPKRYSVLGGFR